MAINFGLLNTNAPAEIGATIGNALALRRQRDLQDEQLAQQREQQAVQNALARMNLQKTQADLDEEAAYKAALRGAPSGDMQAAMPQLMQASPSRAMALQKQLAEVQRGNVDTQSKLSDIAHKTLGMYREQLVNVKTPQQFAQWLTAQHNDPALAPIMGSLPSLEDSLASIPQDPREFEQMKMKSALGLGKFMEMNKPIARTLNLGGQERVQMVNPNTGEIINEQAYGKTMSPGEIAADARARAQLAQSERQFQAQQGIAQQRLSLEREKQGQKQTAPEQKASDAREVLQLLDQAEPLLNQATGSYLGAGIDVVGRGAGISTQGALAGAQLRAIEGMLISKMPKMSGPQSDKDVLLYKQMAGQIGDPTIPAAQKRAAMSAIRQINERYAGGSSAAPANVPQTNARGWTLHTDASGNRAYVSPDGRQFEEVR